MKGEFNMIKEIDYINTIAKIRFRETKMLSKNDIESLVLAKNIDECIKLLYDKGFGTTDQRECNIDKTISKIIREETEKLYDFIRSLCPKPFELKFLLYENDFHNIKAQLKSIYYDSKIDNIFLPEGNISIEDIKEASIKMNFSNFPEFCREVVVKSNEVLKQTRDGQLFDIMIDRGCYEAIKNDILSIGNKFLIDLYNLIFALSNVQVAIRGSKLKKSQEFYDKVLMDNDLICKEELINNSIPGEKSLMEYLVKIGFGNVIEKASLEKAIQDEIFKFIEQFKYKSTGLEPVVSYLFNKKKEIKIIRIILNLKRNLFSPEEIRDKI